MSAVFEENEVDSVVVVGFKTCPFYQEALQVAEEIKSLAMADGATHHQFETRAEFKEWLKSVKSLGIDGNDYLSHTSSPFVYALTKEGKKLFVGMSARWIQSR